MKIRKLVLASDDYAVFQNFSFAGVYALATTATTGTAASAGVFAVRPCTGVATTPVRRRETGLGKKMVGEGY